MKLIIFGAGGGVGRELVAQALTRGHEVTASYRAASAQKTAPKLRSIVCDVSNLPEVERAVAGHDAVLCAIGSNSKGAVSLYSEAARNLIDAMTAQSVSRLIFLSNFGVLDERAQGLRQAVLLRLIKGLLQPTLRDHRAALEIMRASQIDWTAVRAMPLTNGPRTGRYRIARESLPARGAEIARADVAHFMLEAAETGGCIREAPALAY